MEVQASSGHEIILDAGTGIRPLGNDLLSRMPGGGTVHFLLTHAHWDHVLGFPFFKPIYRKDFQINLEGCTTAQETIRGFLEKTMDPPFFPVPFHRLSGNITTSQVCQERFDIGSVTIETYPISHPNGGYGFKLSEGGRSVVFFPDNELNFDHPGGKGMEDYAEYCAGADLLIHDSEYLRDEYESFSKGWGHSIFEDTVELARLAGVKQLWLWHLNQDRDDDGVDALVDQARQLAGSALAVEAPRPGLEAEI